MCTRTGIFQSRYTTIFLDRWKFSNGSLIVGSNLPRGDMQTRPNCTLRPRGLRLREGCYKHKSFPGQRNPPASASLWRWQGGFLCPWPYNNCDRGNANSPRGFAASQLINVDPFFLCSTLFFPLSITRALAESKALYTLKYSPSCSCTNDKDVCSVTKG